MLLRSRIFGSHAGEEVKSGQIVITGDAGNQCYISRDYGNTFSELDGRPSGAIISTDGSIIVLLRYDGVMISRDGGYVFTNLDLKNCTCGKILDNGDVILMGDSRTTPLLYIIKVNGEIIQRRLPEWSRWMDATSDGKHLFILLLTSILYSSDLGLSFVRYDRFGEAYIPPRKIVVIPPKNVFVIMYGGRTNTRKTRALISPWVASYWDMELPDISVSSDGLIHLYGSLRGGAYSSKDGGVTLRQLQSSGSRVPCVEINQDGSIQYLATGYKGLMVSRDGGETFRGIEDLRNVEIDFITTNK